MPLSRCAVAMALGLALAGPGGAGIAGEAGASAQSPRIARPRPAPPSASTMPPLPPAEFDHALTIDGDDIKARKAQTRMTVQVRVNGRGPYRFVVDSGADTSVVGLRIADGLQLPLGTPVVLNGMTARSIVDRVKVDELALGASTFRNLELPALQERDLGGDGLLGIDALANQRLMMDFEDLTIRAEDARTPVKTYPGEIVVTGKRRRGQLILTAVRAAGMRLDAVIDTGTEITIGNLALRDRLIRSKREKVWPVTAIGVTGEPVQLQLAIVSELRLGPVTLRDVPVAFADLPPFQVFGLADQPALLLGTDILETFRRVSLDFRARKVRFQLRRCETSGVLLYTNPTMTRTRLSPSESGEACRR